MNKQAYLIVICDKETNAVIEATVWSSPEWEQSMCIENPTYVAYACSRNSYAEAKLSIMQSLMQPGCRYHWLLPYVIKRSLIDLKQQLEERHSHV